MDQFANSFMKPVQQQAGNYMQDFSNSAIGQAAQGKFGNVPGAIGNELSGIASGKVPLNFGAEMEDVTPMHVSYASQTLDPEATGKIVDFVNHVNTKGSKTVAPNSSEVQSMANDIFGKQTSAWSNQRLANAFDDLLGRIGKKWNSAGVYR